MRNPTIKSEKIITKNIKWLIFSSFLLIPIFIFMFKGFGDYLDWSGNYHLHNSKELQYRWLHGIAGILLSLISFFIMPYIILKPYKSKLIFTNYKLKNTALFFSDDIDGPLITNDFPFINPKFYWMLISYLVLIWFLIQLTFYRENTIIKEPINYILSTIFTWIWILYLKYFRKDRNEKILAFPIMELSAKKINILVQYDYYINQKIEVDEPCLEINQRFITEVKEYPRNPIEEREIKILNPKTPKKPALVTIINDKNLAKIIRNGKEVLKAELVSINENTTLEIALWLEKK